MANILNFKEWYTVDGVDFATPGYWIANVDKGHAGRKGNNIDVPSIHGSAWRQKRLTTRNESWNIVITDADPTTGAISSTIADRRSQFNANYDTVMSVLNKLASQLTILHNRVNTSNSSLTDIRVAYGEITSNFSLSDHRDLMYAEFTVDVEFTDPRWYDASVYTPALSASITTAVSSASISNSASVIGTAPVTYMTITFTPASGQTLVNPRLTNSTYTSSQSVIGYTGTISSGTSIVINTDALTIKTGTGTNVSASLYRTGSVQDWMVLHPTTNTLTFSVDGTTSRGSCTISYQRAYI
jgi:hypothetical protein